MAEPRDRLVRDENPLTPMMLGRRFSDGIWQDFSLERSSHSSSSTFSVGSGRNLFRSSIQSVQRSTIMSSSLGIPMRRGTLYSTPQISRSGSGRRENSMFSGSSRRRNGSSTSGRGGRRNNTPLPEWYPRTPLRDISSVVSAIERRRNRLREAKRHRLPDPSPPESSASVDPNVSSLTTPNLKASIKSSSSEVPLKIFLGTNATDGSDFLTPQKKLLNSIDEVERIVLDELRRIKRTPSARRAEREKKVRILMAMR